MSTLPGQLFDFDGVMCIEDRRSLQQVIKAFFLQSDQSKLFELLTRAYIEIENFEGDITNMSIYGNVAIQSEVELYLTQRNSIIEDSYKMANEFMLIKN